MTVYGSGDTHASNTAPAGTLNRRVLNRLDALFKLTCKYVVYQLAYMTLLNYAVGTTLQGV